MPDRRFWLSMGVSPSCQDGALACADAHWQHETITRIDAGEAQCNGARRYNVNQAKISRLTR
jgi:hypothetical protein